MDEFEHIPEEKLGSVKISDEVIAICAINATIRTPGVANMTGGLSDSITKTIMGKDPLSKGVKVNQSEDGIEVDVYVIVDYGVKIPQVAWEIQGRVKKEVESMTDREVIAVNIHVQGVEAPEKEI